MRCAIVFLGILAVTNGGMAWPVQPAKSCPEERREAPKSDPCCFDQGEVLPDCYPAAYNAPANVQLTQCCKSMPDVFIDASFIYWYAGQDGMVIAGSGDLGTSGGLAELFFNNECVSLIQPFDYSPGFKVGLGMEVQDWELHAEYTWIRQETKVSSNAPTNESLGGARVPVWVLAQWFAEGIEGYDVSATHVSSNWHLGMDLLDVTAGRPYYQSRRSIISPYGGIRALWIRQQLNIAATVPAAAVVGSGDTLVSQPLHSKNYSHSWALGLVAGATGNWLLGQGFRIEGDGGVSLLFTQYSTLFHSETDAILGNLPLENRAKITNYNCMRPALNLGLGLGWGSYLYDSLYHIDFSADYDFNLFWNQNMMLFLIQEFASSRSSNGDLFLHGLTLKGRFDF